MKNIKISFVIPLFNDWESLSQLLKEILLYKENKFSIEKIIVINDGSTLFVPNHILKNEFVTVVDLSTNLGHQRSIAIGLCYCYEHLNSTNFVVVMDSDGEDNPKDIIKMLNYAEENKNAIIFAKREKRSESIFFKINYLIYKWIYKILTKSEISFGNFSLIPFKKLENIISNPDLWNHYSSSVIKSKLLFNTIPTQRGKRYFGKSKMNFTNLIVHGLSSISVFIDLIVVRLLVLNIIAVFISLLALLSIFLIRIFSNYEIPGWTPIYTLGIFNVLIFSSIFTLLLVLVQLGNRSIVKKPPKSFYKNFFLNN